MARGVLWGTRMQRVVCILSVGFLACGAPGELELVTEPVRIAVDAGTGCGTLPFGPDCCEGGRRTTSATCVSDAWVCTLGTFCTCAGKAQPFQCAEYCGSDAFVAPDCVNGEWICSAPTAPTANCRADTCWGEPGECCGGAACVDGGWTCAFTPSDCG